MTDEHKLLWDKLRKSLQGVLHWAMLKKNIVAAIVAKNSVEYEDLLYGTFVAMKNWRDKLPKTLPSVTQLSYNRKL